jgi:hypothetical protein
MKKKRTSVAKAVMVRMFYGMAEAVPFVEGVFSQPV